MKKEKKFYKKVEYHRKIGQAIASTLFVLGIAAMSVFPESHSKYITSGQVELGSATLYPKEQGTLTKDNFKLLGSKDTAPPPGTNYNSDETYAFIKVSFTKNSVDEIIGDSHDYVVKTPTCNIVYVNGTKISGSVKEYTIPSIGKENQVIMKCSVKNNTQGNNLKASIQIEETIKDTTFTYKTGEFIESIDSYKDKYSSDIPVPEPEIVKTKEYISIPTVFINEDSTYSTEFVSWLDMIVDDASYDETVKQNIKSYIRNSYSNLASLKSDQSLPSIKFYHPNTEGNKEDVYKLEIIRENLVGYAKTYQNHMANPNLMYFSSMDSKIVQDAFIYYLTHYKYPIKDDAQLVLDYVDLMSEHKGLSYLMETDELGNLKYEIPGIKYEPEGQKVTLEDTLLIFAYTKINSIIKLSYDNPYVALTGYDEMLRKIFKFEKYEIDILEGNDILNLILMKPTEKFNKFFVYNAVDTENSNSSYLLVHMYSDDLSSLFIEVTKVPFEKTTNTLTLTVDITNYKTTEITDLTSAVESLFNDKKVEFTIQDESDKKTIVYTVTDKVTGDEIVDNTDSILDLNENVLSNTNIQPPKVLDGANTNKNDSNGTNTTKKVDKSEENFQTVNSDNKTEQEDKKVKEENSVKISNSETDNVVNANVSNKMNVSNDNQEETLDLDTKVENVNTVNTTSQINIGAPPVIGDNVTPDIGIEEVASGFINFIEPVATG